MRYGHMKVVNRLFVGNLGNHHYVSSPTGKGFLPSPSRLAFAAGGKWASPMQSFDDLMPQSDTVARCGKTSDWREPAFYPCVSFRSNRILQIQDLSKAKFASRGFGSSSF